MGDSDRFSALRADMVSNQLAARGITDSEVLRAMGKMPRHRFVPSDVQDKAYNDQAISLGPGQSISQPYVVALMLQSVEIQAGDKVLDVGTGSGYQTALLAELGAEVYSIEIDPALSRRSGKLLRLLGYSEIHLRSGDGKRGWREAAPFDAIVVSAACEEIPRDLVRQLKIGGRIVLPLGEDYQYLIMMEKTEDGLKTEELGSVQFVKMK
ncbi:MAG: protein-L-isoaspartate(D-aspartate) O-methyltransferase [Deltaproteobacteria bacterium]|nr:protein-L-isoaspartate(D-aspartate) O-methyltransferase [Deltaproteobacteria bacterium]